MHAYLSGSEVRLTISLLDATTGEAIQATAIEYRVVDESETDLTLGKLPLTAYVEGDESVEVVIEEGLNVLPLDTYRSLRVVELYLTTAAGIIRLEDAYLLEAEHVLIEGANSFMSMSKAVFMGFEIPNLTGWNNADKAQRIAGLLSARRNIGMLRFKVYADERDTITESILGSVGSDLLKMNSTQWAALPLDFKLAICRAQLIEADYLLGGDEIGDIRRSGLMSMTVGEAKQFFRPGKSVEGPICKRAYKEISRYVLSGVRIGRG